MSETYDVIVIGAGHNGLVAGAALAKRGHRVAILERRALIGGLCAREEFHPGYSALGLLHDTRTLRGRVADVLDLAAHGLEFADGFAGVLGLDPPDGRGLLISGDVAKSCAEIESHSRADAEAFGKWRKFIERVRPVIEPVLNEDPPDLADFSMPNLMTLAQRGLAARRLGAEVLMGLLRIPAMCVADWLREYFEGEHLSALLAGPAISGTWCGPWSPGTAANLLIRECTAGREVRGGGAALIDALGRAARHHGAEVRAGAGVQGIFAEGGRVRGVVLDGGETVEARAVVSTVDPKTTLLSLVSPEDLPPHAFHQAEVYRSRGTTACVRLALGGTLGFACREGRFARAATGATLDTLEKAFDAVKYRRMSDAPWLDIQVCSVVDKSAAPADCDSLSILAHFVPHDLEGGWNDEARERLGDVVLDELERVAPGARNLVVGREVLAPIDIETRYGCAGGHIHHGEHALDQLVVRPFPSAGRFAGPIDGLYLGGSGSFPGGGITGAPGLLCAMSAMRSL